MLKKGRHWASECCQRKSVPLWPDVIFWSSAQWTGYYFKLAPVENAGHEARGQKKRRSTERALGAETVLLVLNPAKAMLPWICSLVRRKFTRGVWASVVRITTCEAANKSRWWPGFEEKGLSDPKHANTARARKKWNFTSWDTRELLYYFLFTALFSFPPTDSQRLSKCHMEAPSSRCWLQGPLVTVELFPSFFWLMTSF